MSTENQTPEIILDTKYPKRLELRSDQSYLKLWEVYFEHQYQSECARLGLTPDPKQETLL